MANVKITDLVEITAPISTDLLECVSGGTVSKKVAIRNLFKGGGQIAFPSTAVLSTDPNTLDDYEEGESTATIVMSTSGTVTLDGSIETLAYTKIGRQVTLTGEISVSSVSSPLGRMQITLPFAASDLTDKAGGAGGSMYTNLVDYPSGTTAPILRVIGGSSVARINAIGDGVTADNIVPKASDDFSFNLTYFTDL